jgi:hypothetical protein
VKHSAAASHQILSNRLARIDEILARPLINDNTRTDYEAARAQVEKALEALPAVCKSCGTVITSAESLRTGLGSECRTKGAA